MRLLPPETIVCIEKQKRFPQFLEQEMVAITYSPALTGSFEKPNPYAAQDFPSRQNDLDAFNDLVIAHQDAVFHQAYWILGEEEAAQDATQEAFVRAYQNMHKFNGGLFLPWILRITSNYCLDQLRRIKKRKTTRLEDFDEYNEEIENPAWMRDTGASVEEMIERSEIQTRILHCINHLPTEYRVAVILVDVQNRNYKEAASMLGIPLGTFKSRLSRARAHLQKWLSPERQPLLQHWLFLLLAPQARYANPGYPWG
jgi:RNA polymerase sigma-70 factor (ECF subfamily)